MGSHAGRGQSSRFPGKVAENHPPMSGVLESYYLIMKRGDEVHFSGSQDYLDMYLDETHGIKIELGADSLKSSGSCL